LTSLARDVTETGRDLAVDALVEGSIRESEGRIRVLVHMVDARSGAALWAEQFDEPFTDVFAVEDRIAEQIGQTLLQELTRGERDQLVHRVTASSDAYRLYLQGRYFWNERTPVALQKGVGYFREAIAVDPTFALAWAGLADSELPGASPASPREAMELARAAATKAIGLDDSLAEAHASLGRVLMSFDVDWAQANDAFARAIALNPGYATAHQWRANLLLALGRTEEALTSMQHARALEPFSLILDTAVGWVFHMSRRFDEAIASYRATLEMEPNFGMGLREIAVPLERVGRCEEALEMLRRAAPRKAIRCWCVSKGACTRRRAAWSMPAPPSTSCTNGGRAATCRRSRLPSCTQRSEKRSKPLMRCGTRTRNDRLHSCGSRSTRGWTISARTCASLT
jgi:hypothetical protein